MNRRELGRTGIQVSVLGFGAAALGGVYGRISAREARRVVRYAMDHGINYFDTAPAYGDGLSEIRVGEALAGRRREVVLASKAGRFQPGGRLEFDFSAAGLRRSLEDSLARMNTDYLDIFQLHDVEYADFKQILDEALPELQAMKEKGKVRAIGVTGRPTELLVRLAEEARPDMVLSYGHYTLLSTAMMERLAPACASLEIGIVNAAPLEMGLLAPDGPPPWHPASPKIKEAVRRAREFCSGYGISLETVAVQFALANPAVASTLVGMRTVEEIKCNISSLGRPPAPALLEELRNLLP